MVEKNTIEVVAEHYIELYALAYKLYATAKSIELSETSIKVMALLCRYGFTNKIQINNLLVNQLQLFEDVKQVDKMLNSLIKKDLLAVKGKAIIIPEHLNFKIKKSPLVFELILTIL